MACFPSADFRSFLMAGSGRISHPHHCPNPKSDNRPAGQTDFAYDRVAGLIV